MDPIAVDRINEQPEVALFIDSSAMSEITALSAVMLQYGWTTTTSTRPEHPGYWQGLIQHERQLFPDQFCYPYDWIVVTEAEWDPTKEGFERWKVSPYSQVIVYGRLGGVFGNTHDFLEKYRGRMPINWGAARLEPPRAVITPATDDTPAALALVFAEPLSATGPLTYTVTTARGDTVPILSRAADKDGVTTLTLDPTSIGRADQYLVTITDYYGQVETSLPSNPVAAARAVAEPDHTKTILNGGIAVNIPPDGGTAPEPEPEPESEQEPEEPTDSEGDD